MAQKGILDLYDRFKLGLIELSSRNASDSNFNYNHDKYNWGLINSIKPTARELLSQGVTLDELSQIASNYLVSEGDWNPNLKRPEMKHPCLVSQSRPTYNRRPPYRFNTDIGLIHVETGVNDRGTSQSLFDIEVYHKGAYYFVSFLDVGNNAEYRSDLYIPNKLKSQLSASQCDALHDLIEERLYLTQDISWTNGTQEWYQFDTTTNTYIKYKN